MISTRTERKIAAFYLADSHLLWNHTACAVDAIECIIIDLVNCEYSTIHMNVIRYVHEESKQKYRYHTTDTAFAAHHTLHLILFGSLVSLRSHAPFSYGFLFDFNFYRRFIIHYKKMKTMTLIEFQCFPSFRWNFRIFTSITSTYDWSETNQWKIEWNVKVFWTFIKKSKENQIKCGRSWKLK